MAKNERPGPIKMISLLVAGLCLAGNLSGLYAEDNTAQIVIGESIHFRSQILDEEREIFIFCPRGYGQGDRKFPVLYLLDAEYQFHYVTGVVAFLSEIGHIPEMIVVGITNTDRERDLTPEPGEQQKKRFPTSGGAEEFLTFLQDELIPYIESRYRIQPFKVLAGWSLGGLFSIHAMLSRSETFDAYIAMSPSLYWNDQIESAKAAKLFRDRTSFRKTLFMTMGNERDEMVGSSEKFSKVLENDAPPDFSWKYEPMPEETHSSIKLKSIYRGLEFIFSDLRYAGTIKDAGFKDHYNTLAEKYGYSINLSQDFLFDAYTIYWEKKRYNDAVDVVAFFSTRHPEAFRGLLPRFVQAAKELMESKHYESAIELYTLVANVNDKIFAAFKGLGDAYFAQGNREDALENYKKALALRPSDSFIKEQIDKLTKKTPDFSL